MVISGLRAAQVLPRRHANHGFEVMTEVRLIGIARLVRHLNQRFRGALFQQLAGKSDPVQASVLFGGQPQIAFAQTSRSCGS